MEIYTVEYSVSQDAYHLDSLPNIISKNLHTIDRGKSNDYLLIGVFRTYNQASDFIQRHMLFNPTRILSDCFKI